MFPDVLQGRAQRVQRVGAWLLIAVGTIVLVAGWWLGIDLVTRLLPGLVSMKANAAAGFILLGLALLPDLRTRAPRAATLAALGAYVIGLATWFEYALGIDLGLDQALATDRVLIGTTSPGRMGLNDAIAFTVAGGGALLSRALRGQPWRIGLSQLLAALTGLLALMPFLGYLYGVSSARGLGTATQMALHTSLSFLVTAVTLGAATADRGILGLFTSPQAGGRTARRLIFPTLVALVVTGWLEVLVTRAGLVDDVGVLATLATTVALTVVFFVLLLTAHRLDRTAQAAERASAEVAESQRDLAAILSAFDDEHYRLGPDGAILSHHGGRPGVDVRGQMIQDVLPDDVRDRLVTALLDRTAGSGQVEFVFDRDIDGRVVPYEARVSALGSGQIAMSMRNVSETVRAKTELETLNRELEDRVAARTRELEQSNADLEQFAYLASHDLQEPLRMVSSFVTRLADRYGDQLDDRGRQYVEFAVDGAQRMSVLIEALLHYSRTGRAELHVDADVDAHRLCEDVVATLKQRIEESGATVVVAPDLPHIAVDPVLFRQVLQNLIGNALKFTDPERPAVVSVDAVAAPDGWAFAVEDNGQGIPPEFRDQVFKMFRRLHSRKDKPGTGIGLSIVQRIVERHGGTIWIEAAEPHGTRFMFTVPAARPASEDDETGEDAADLSGAAKE